MKKRVVKMSSSDNYFLDQNHRIQKKQPKSRSEYLIIKEVNYTL